MNLGLQGKTALVTGAASGIGRATALALAREGVAVAFGDLDRDRLHAAAQEAASAGLSAISVPIDVSLEDDCSAALRRVREEFGRVDILVNNAGVLSCQKLDEISSAEWDRVFAVNLRGAFLLSRDVLPKMMARQWGRIVNVSSMAGKVGGLVAGAHYSASKAALICLTKTLARVGAAAGVTVNAVAPAFIRTPLFTDEQLAAEVKGIPMGRAGEPEEIADVIAFLASERAGFITGHTVDINGGIFMD